HHPHPGNTHHTPTHALGCLGLRTSMMSPLGSAASYGGFGGTGSPAVAVMAIAATDTWVARPLTTA
ncbi:hypothetical protein, partial [Mycobacterium marinum]|uniref:hypothetical protein n=1 Tax=Mycobacterium marinum TaxID=1781 RepID=UPI0021C3F64D